MEVTMLRISRSILFLLVVLILYIQNANAVSFADLSKVANDFNKTLPRMLNSETQCVSVAALENTLLYKYVLVNYRSSQITAQYIQKLVANDTRNGVCSNPSTRKLLKAGVAMVYSYYSADGFYITEIPVHETDCH
ncbi:MAG: hypothetical protein EPN88_12700 [Bacteroidetes bacterium]|nr:MAG: hypothetical protein EPN88_12700 [Bacteroidota bacterium]